MNELELCVADGYKWTDIRVVDNVDESAFIRTLDIG